MSRKPFAVVTDNGTVVRQDVLDSYAVKQGGSEGSKQITDQFSQLYDTHGLVQPLYNPEALSMLLEVNTFHMRSCRTKARDTAGQGFRFIERERAEEPNESQKDELRKFFTDLDTPLTTTLALAQLDYEACGWGALEIVRQNYEPDGKVLDIKHVPAHTIRLHREENKFAQRRGAKVRWFRRAGHEMHVHQDSGHEGEGNEVPRDQRATEIMWWVNPTPRSDYYGIPDVIPALGAIHGDVSRRDYNIAFFSNYGVPAYAVFITGDFDPGEPDPDTGKTELEDQIEQHFKELAGKPNSILVMSIPTPDTGGGEVQVEFQPLATDVQEDAAFRMYRQDNRDEILAAHGVPPYRIGIAAEGSLGGTTARESTIIYKQSVIDPRQDDIENLFDRHVLPYFGVVDWRFELVEVDTTDETHDLTVLTGMFEMGAVTPMEVRKHFSDRFGLETDRDELPGDLELPEEMDQFYIQGAPIVKEDPPEMEPGAGGGGQPGDGVLPAQTPDADEGEDDTAAAMLSLAADIRDLARATKAD